MAVPASELFSIPNSSGLPGKELLVPEMYVGLTQEVSAPVWTYWQVLFERRDRNLRCNLTDILN